MKTTTVAFQKISEARFEQDAETVRATTRRLVVRATFCVHQLAHFYTGLFTFLAIMFQAEKAAIVTVLQAEATVGALELSVQAEAQALNVTISAEASAYKQVMRYVLSEYLLLGCHAFLFLNAYVALPFDVHLHQLFQFQRY